MLDTHKIYKKLMEKFSAEQADALTIVISEAFFDFEKLATKQELSELKDAIRELAEAQKKTELRLDELTARVNELAEAQKRTEEHLNALTEIVRKLAEEMFEMRRRFAEEIEDIRADIREIRQQVGGLSMAVGYGIEDRVMPYFFALGEKDYGMKILKVERRNYVYPDGRYDEINIYAEGIKNDETYLIIAKCKAQPSKKDADRFAQMVERLSIATQKKVFPILIGYIFQPDVETYIRERYLDVRLMKTYEFEINYKLRA